MKQILLYYITLLIIETSIDPFNLLFINDMSFF